MRLQVWFYMSSDTEYVYESFQVGVVSNIAQNHSYNP